MSHYDALGVPKNADAATIKRAYRRKARAAHPDRQGGDHRAMVAVNRAFETLSDPARRARYDQTGDDTGPEKSRDQLARDAIMQFFGQVLDKASDYDDVISQVASKIRDNLTQIRNNIASASKRVTRLERSRKRLKHKGGGENFLDALLADQIAKTNGAIENARTGIAVLERAQELLSDFTWQPDERPIGGRSSFRSYEAELTESLTSAFEEALKNFGRGAG